MEQFPSCCVYLGTPEGCSLCCCPKVTHHCSSRYRLCETNHVSVPVVTNTLFSEAAHFILALARIGHPHPAMGLPLARHPPNALPWEELVFCSTKKKSEWKKLLVLIETCCFLQKHLPAKLSSFLLSGCLSEVHVMHLPWIFDIRGLEIPNWKETWSRKQARAEKSDFFGHLFWTLDFSTQKGSLHTDPWSLDGQLTFWGHVLVRTFCFV